MTVNKTNMFKFNITHFSESVLQLMPTSSEPIAIMIMRSGWSDMYHVITEWGDIGDTYYEHLPKYQILEKYGIEEMVLPTKGNLVGIDVAKIKATPNDAELGAYVRRKIYKPKTKDNDKTSI
jgi:hypothetical protein